MAETVQNSNGSEGKLILSSPLQLKGFLSYSDKCPPRKLHCMQELPHRDTRMLPGAQTAKVCTCGQLFCLKTYPRMKNSSYKLCHWTRLSREVSSEFVPGRKSNEVTLSFIIIIVSLMWNGVLVSECPDGVASMKCPSKGHNSSRYFVMV